MSTIDKEAVDKFLAQSRRNYDFMKRMSRGDLVTEIRDQCGRWWPFRGRKPDLHQLACFIIGLSRPRFMYLLDMSAGKTWLMLLLFKWYKMKGKVNQMLVLVPKKVHIGSWENEVTATGELSYCGIDVQNIERKWTELELSSADVTVIDYQGFELATAFKVKQGRKWKYQRDDHKVKCLRQKYQAITLDEIHRCKNHMSLRYAIVRQLTKDAFMVNGLTGTPTDKDPEALWAQFNLVDNGSALGATLGLYRAAFFKKAKGYFGGEDFTFDKDKLALLRTFLKHSSIRYRDDEFSDLAPVVHVPPTVYRLPPDQRADYSAVARGHIVDGIRVPTDGVFHHMRRISSGYDRVEKGGVSVTVRYEENPRLEDLEMFFDDLPYDRKALVFFEYTESARIITDELTKRKLGFILLDGSTKDPRSVERMFNTVAKNRVLVLQNSCAEGLNVQTANYTYFFELPTSAITWAQAIKRTHRRGQLHRCFVRCSFPKGGVEERLYKALKEGRDFLIELSSNARGAARSLFDVAGL